jgi:hypothetical protein
MDTTYSWIDSCGNTSRIERNTTDSLIVNTKTAFVYKFDQYDARKIDIFRKDSNDCDDTEDKQDQLYS